MDADNEQRTRPIWLWMLPLSFAAATLLAIAFASDASWFGTLGRTVFPVLFVYAIRFVGVQQLRDPVSAALAFYTIIGTAAFVLTIDPRVEWSDKFAGWLGVLVVQFGVPAISFAVFELASRLLGMSLSASLWVTLGEILFVYPAWLICCGIIGMALGIFAPL